MKSTWLTLPLLPVLVALASCGAAASGESAARIATANGFTTRDAGTFEAPWAMAFIPGTKFALVTERSGKLKLWEEGGTTRTVSGVPPVVFEGQGGLGDVKLAPDFDTSGIVYLTWAEAGTGDTRGAVMGRGKLVLGDNPRLEGFTTIWRQAPKVTGHGHYSHRIAFSPDGKYLFLSSGDRQKFTPAQDLAGNLGKVLRLLPDGTPAPGNPFAGKGGVSAEIWSYGHRNLLGLKFDADGQLWDIEHGPAGGDELNQVLPGKNYGWPLVSDGDHYDGRKIPHNSTRPDLATPAISWNPVIAPGNFIFVKGGPFKDWDGDVLVAGLASAALVRVRIEGEKAHEVARYPMGARVRDVVQRDDGSIWVLEDGGEGHLLQLVRR